LQKVLGGYLLDSQACNTANIETCCGDWFWCAHTTAMWSVDTT